MNGYYKKLRKPWLMEKEILLNYLINIFNYKKKNQKIKIMIVFLILNIEKKKV